MYINKLNKISKLLIIEKQLLNIAKQLLNIEKQIKVLDQPYIKQTEYKTQVPFEVFADQDKLKPNQSNQIPNFYPYEY